MIIVGSTRGRSDVDTKLRTQLIDLLTETGKAHLEAFRATDGHDPEWPIWYAEHLKLPLTDLLNTEFSKSELIYCLMSVESERAAVEPDSEWAPYYASHFIEHFSAASDAASDALALYMFSGCPFCWRRPIWAAPNPRAAAEAIQAEIAGVG